MRSRRMRPVSWSTSYLFLLPAGISMVTSKVRGSMGSLPGFVVADATPSRLTPLPYSYEARV